MTITLSLATVDTPEAQYLKAIVELDDEKLVVMDRRRNVLLTVDAVRVDVGPGRWTYGPDVLVSKASGCACGGTRVVNK